MNTKYSLTFCIILVSLSKNLAENVNIINPVRYPYGGPFVGIFLAIAVPLELPNYNVFVSYNFEANYNLPQNETDYSWPPDVTRDFPIDRKLAYTAIENKMTKHGYPGKACLLRAVCEASEYSMQHNGVLADLLHIILTPSASRTEGLNDYELAEKYVMSSTKLALVLNIYEYLSDLFLNCCFLVIILVAVFAYVFEELKIDYRYARYAFP